MRIISMPTKTGKMPGSLAEVTTFGCAPFVVVLSGHAGGWDVGSGDVDQDPARGFGVEPRMGMHRIGDDAPLVRTLVPASGIAQPWVGAAGPDDRGFELARPPPRCSCQ